LLKTDLQQQTSKLKTFVGNMSLPIHRWYRFSAGFSAEWIKEFIQNEKKKGTLNVLDPFAGSGTVLISGDSCGVNTIGLESHPFVFRIAKAKLHWTEDTVKFEKFAMSILNKAKKSKSKKHISSFPKLIQKCYSPIILHDLFSLRQAWEFYNDNTSFSELAWLAIVSIIRETSHAGTAPWQYVLPKKSKSKIIQPFIAYQKKIVQMIEDMKIYQLNNSKSKARIFNDDARECKSVPKNWANLVVTSPPYANNYDYADATRLEMTFFGEISGWGDLQESVRKYLIRSCTQHVSDLIKETDKIILDSKLEPIRSELSETCKKLEKERINHGGKKAYHTMIASYFADMAKVWHSLRNVTKKGALVCFVIGDSAPYGIHVPVEKWFGELAISAGFDSYHFEKTRDRNVKWKNRKHRVPLHEGCLWVKG